MARFNFPAINGYSLRGVDDWLCFVTDRAGNWYTFYTECDPLWRTLPSKWSRYALGLGRGTGNPDTSKHRREAAETIAAIGLRKLQLGQTPRPVDADCVADCQRLFGARMRITKRGAPWFATCRDRGNFHFARGCDGGLHIQLNTGPARGTNAKVTRESDGGVTFHHGWTVKRCFSAREVLAALKLLRWEARRQPKTWRAVS